MSICPDRLQSNFSSMTITSILYWLPPKNREDNPHYEQFCICALILFKKWLGQSYALGIINQDQYKTYLKAGVQDIPGS